MEDETQRNSKEVTNEEKELLYGQIETLRCDLAALRAENDLFERCISRLDAEDLVPQAPEESLETAGASQLEGGLTLEQKLYLAKREVTETRRDLMKLMQEQGYGGNQDNYKASLQEAEICLSENQRVRKKFECRLLKPNREINLETEPKEVISYIVDRSKNTQEETLKLENYIRPFKAQEKKLQQKEAVEDDRNDKILDELKLKNMKVQHILSSHKKMLQQVMQEYTELSNDIAKKKQLLEKLETDLQHAEKERLKATALNQHLRRQMADYHAPDISEYMRVKAKQKKLQRSVHTSREARIAAMVLRTHTKARSTQRTTLTPANSVVADAPSGKIPVKLPDIGALSI